MSLKLVVLSAFLAAAEAFTAVAGMRPTTPLRTTTPKAMIAPDALATMLPTTMTAEDPEISSLALASGHGLPADSARMVAVVVINFGVRRSKEPVQLLHRGDAVVKKVSPALCVALRGASVCLRTM